MTNIFEETYNTIAEAKKAYKAATTAEERDTARDTAKAAEDRIIEMGDIACKIWRAYREIKRQRERDPRLRRHHLGPGCGSHHHLHEGERHQGLHLLLPGNGRGRDALAF
jgi:hypothetical protein